jgi:hypothetical protein
VLIERKSEAEKEIEVNFGGSKLRFIEILNEFGDDARQQF